jgi:hypothetical protein
MQSSCFVMTTLVAGGTLAGWLNGPAAQPSPAPPQPILPQIVSFSATMNGCMDHLACITLTWQTRGAVRVSAQSGHVTNGVFKPGGWYSHEDLPPNGTGGFTPKIGNDAVQLCAWSASGASECRVLTPMG